MLLSGGPYTQAPGSNIIAMRWCDVAGVTVTDGPNPARGQAAFYLVTGNQGGVESSLDSDSLGHERPNDNPCP